MKVKYYLSFLFFISMASIHALYGQCGGVMEPGFKFLTSSRGCAPFTVNLETFYLFSVPGTTYYIDWGDGTPEEVVNQVSATGVLISHNYPNASINCGYDLVIDASNACNPRGSVVPINTQVIVWTNDVVDINPQTFRVCQGFAANLSFTDASQWNCFPRATRENSEPRWIQWVYGTGALANQIGGVQVNAATPGGFPYLDPAPNRNPRYPVVAPGLVSLPINVPITAVGDVGKEFVVTLKNWNQCNAYDNNVLDGNGLNPVSGDLINGDNLAQIVSGRIVIVPSPQPNFVTRLANAAGPVQTVFCIGDDIFFDDQTPSISGASFDYTWQFFDNATGTGLPLSTSTTGSPTFAYPTAGQKLIRLLVQDVNAAGGCVNTIDKVITISPSLVAKISVADLLNNPIVPDFCQEAVTPFTVFQVRFADVSVGTVTPTTQWRWEFYSETNALVRSEPAVGFSTTPFAPLDQPFTNRGIYRVRLRVRDNVTSCESVDEVQVRVYEKPTPAFTANRVCENSLTDFVDNSSLTPINGEVIALREWDFNYTGVFTKDPAFDNQTTFSRALGPAATYQVALRVTTSQNACSNLFILSVTVDPLPNAVFTPSVSSGCGPLTISFTNNSVGGQPDVIDRFEWEVDALDGNGFLLVATQRPIDPGFTNLFTNRFQNFTTTNKLYNVRLRVFTINGCERISTTQVITVFPGTISGFSELNYSPFNQNCSPVSVNFRADTQTQSLSPVDYLWSISDSNGLLSQQSTGVDPNFNFNFSNNTNSFRDFQVNLLTTLSSGCQGDSTRIIRVSPVPTSLFVVDTLQFDCNVMELRLTALQKGLSSYHWIIEENNVPVVNSISTQDQIVRSFNRLLGSNLNLSFSLETQNFANCSSAVFSVPLVVPQQDNINASFTATPLNQTLPNRTVSITNTTNAGPWNYLWDFGDNTTATVANPGNHVYTTYGVYQINLTVTSAFCTEAFSLAITINAIPPIVDFSYDPPEGCVPLEVTFTNLTRFAQADTYRWDFGDGTTSQEVNPVHVYNRADNFTVTLSASNITGQIVTETKQNIIQVFPRPTAGFDVKPRLLYIPGGILYTSNLSFEATQFLWDFGDGTFATDEEPEHRYQDEGVYSIELKATNQFGCSDTTKLNNIVRVKKGGQVLLPNAFSPSGGSGGGSGGGSSEGKNDTFLPLVRGVTDFELLIFNRWGELLFESRDATKGWDGTFNGKLCQQDVYMYKLTAKFENGENVVRVGDVNLIR